VVEAEKDFIVYEELRPVATILNQYSEQVSLTRKVAGIEALEFANDFYKSVKEDAEDGVAAAIPIADELGKRYVGRKKSNTKPDTGK
jgi:methylmalonyl-CoA mutase N-terminal domain/subunit